MCESCSTAGIHPPEHRFLRLETDDAANKYLRLGGNVSTSMSFALARLLVNLLPFVFLQTDDDVNPSLVLGLRVYTLKESPASVEGFIGHVKNIRPT